MKTASWLLYTGSGRVGISLGSPRGAPAGYRFYRALAPTRDMLQMSDEEYAPRYQAILANLDPQKVWEDLHALAGLEEDGRQVEPVLMCFERDASGCHRRLVAAWFGTALGAKVAELETGGELTGPLPAQSRE